MTRAALCAIAACAGALAGCTAVADVTGTVAGLASGAASANPAVGLGVGIAVRAATREALRTASRTRQRHEQAAIAAVAADLDPGETGAWALDRRIGGDTHGEVRVLRVIETPVALCKEIAFSVAREADTPRAWFTTTACRVGEEWKWAAAEPAVGRWLHLQ